jgi:hypothetical protein
MAKKKASSSWAIRATKDLKDHGWKKVSSTASSTSFISSIPEDMQKSMEIASKSIKVLSTGTIITNVPSTSFWVSVAPQHESDQKDK